MSLPSKAVTLAQRGREKAKKLVLVVDDYDDGRELFAEMLQYSGYAVETAKDGEEAVRKAQLHLPDVILMDLSLPVMDGCEATRLIKELEATANIPVVALTAHVRPSYQASAAEAGCDQFIAKPCSMSEVVAAVEELTGD